MSKFFLDTEFIEDGKTIDLISIGIVHESGASYYAVSSEFDESKASPWVRENVLPYIGGAIPKSRAEIRGQVIEFVESRSRTSEAQVWGYYADYDWVAFCQLFGTMMDLPDGFPMYCRDLKQWCDELGNPKLPKPSDEYRPEHNALSDAHWNMRVWHYLNEYDAKVAA